MHCKDTGRYPAIREVWLLVNLRGCLCYSLGGPNEVCITCCPNIWIRGSHGHACFGCSAVWMRVWFVSQLDSTSRHRGRARPADAQCPKISWWIPTLPGRVSLCAHGAPLSTLEKGLFSVEVTDDGILEIRRIGSQPWMLFRQTVDDARLPGGDYSLHGGAERRFALRQGSWL